MNTIKYYANIRREDGSICEYEVWGISENILVIDAITSGSITSKNVWGLIHDYDDFYHKNHCDLLVNIWNSEEKDMFKTGYVKVIGLRKEVIGIIEEKQIF